MGGAEFLGALHACTTGTCLCSRKAVLSRRPQPGTPHKKLMAVADICDRSLSQEESQTQVTGSSRKERVSSPYLPVSIEETPARSQSDPLPPSPDQKVASNQ